MTTKKLMAFEVEPELQRQLKMKVAAEGTTIAAVLTDAVKRYLSKPPRKKP